jgi:hypothetical protein
MRKTTLFAVVAAVIVIGFVTVPTHDERKGLPTEEFADYTFVFR